MSHTSFPPHRSRPSIPISSSLALRHLSNYLTTAATAPCLLPNATLQPTGPVAQSDAASNLTIQHLQRVEAGLRGEWLAPSLDLAESDPFAESAQGGKHKKFADEGADAEMGTEGWQDLDEYQREQSIEVGDVGTQAALVGAGEGEDAMPIGVKTSEPKDKEARKKDKKDKEKALKREKAEKARLAASA